MPCSPTKLAAVLFDLDQTLIDSSSLEKLRKKRRWAEVIQRKNELRPFRGVRKLLRELRSKSIRVAVVTSTPGNYCQSVLEHNEIEADTQVCYHDTKQHKPHPAPFEEALKRLNVEAKASVAVGDLESDLTAARRAGVCSVWAAWGGDAGTIPDGAGDLGCRSIEDLHEVLLGANAETWLFPDAHRTRLPAPPFKFWNGIFYVIDYYPGPAGQRDDQSEYVIRVKRGQEDIIKKTAQRLDSLLPKEVTLAVVPPSNPRKGESGVAKIGKLLTKEGSQRCDAVNCLRRHTATPALHAGGDRDPEVHLKTVEVSDPKMIEGRPVVLLDDVTTTGGSLQACGQLLEHAGAASLCLAALGRSVHEPGNLHDLDGDFWKLLPF